LGRGEKRSKRKEGGLGEKNLGRYTKDPSKTKTQFDLPLRMEAEEKEKIAPSGLFL